MANSPAPAYEAQHHAAPRLAAFGLDASECERFTNAFRNVKLAIELVPMEEVAKGETFDGAILRTDARCAPRLAELRALSHRMLIYLVGPMSEIAKYASFGVNAALDSLSDIAIARAVDHTYLLLAGKLRRYTRVPIYVPVNLHVDGTSFPAVTEDLSAGGISALAAPPTSVLVGKPVAVRLALPADQPLQLQGIVCWISAGRIGVQFERGAEQERLRDWVDEFLS